MRFNLMGPFEIVTDDGTIHQPSTPKVCQTLALLLTRSGEIVAAETLIQELWRDEPPRSAHSTVQTYVHHSRRLLESLEPAAAGRQLLVTRAPGYQIRVARENIDVQCFERLVAEAQTELEEGAPEAAARDVQAALRLWRGPALMNVPAGDILESTVVRLEELRIRALELRVEAYGRLGRTRESIPELRGLVHDYPLNEWFHGRLIAALHSAGRRGEALQAYRQLYRILSDELGLEPSPELRRLQSELLNPRSGSGPAVFPQTAAHPAYQERGVVTPLWTASFAG